MTAAEASPAGRLTIVAPWWRHLDATMASGPERVIASTAPLLDPRGLTVVCPPHGRPEDRSSPSALPPGGHPVQWTVIGDSRIEAVARRMRHRMIRSVFQTADRAAPGYLVSLYRYLRRHPTDVIITHGPPLIARWARRARPEATVIFHSHSSELHLLPRPELEALSRAVDAVFVVSQRGLDGLAEAAPDLPAFLVPNGVDPVMFRPADPADRARERAELGWADDDVAIVYAGRLSRRKGVARLAEAFAAVSADHPEARLLLIGDVDRSRNRQRGDAVQEDLDARLGHSADGRHQRIDAVVPARLAHVLGAADIAVFPSIAPEGAPLALLEYAAVGLPIVASDVGTVGEIFHHEDNAVVVPPGTEALRAALARLVAQPDERRRFGEQARRTVSASYTWADHTRRLEEVIAAVQESGRG